MLQGNLTEGLGTKVTVIYKTY